MVKETPSRGKLLGVPVTDVRVPINWVVVPDRGRSEVRLRDVTATAAGANRAPTAGQPRMSPR